MLGLAALPSWSEAPHNSPTRRCPRFLHSERAYGRQLENWRELVHRVNRPPLEVNRPIMQGAIGSLRGVARLVTTIGAGDSLIRLGYIDIDGVAVSESFCR